VLLKANLFKPSSFSTLLFLVALFGVDVKNELSWSGEKTNSFSVAVFAPTESRFLHKVFVCRFGSRYYFMYRLGMRSNQFKQSRS
jgi:hypothetical protein